MFRLREITDYLEQIAPLQLQASYDNAGLITGHLDMEVKGVMVALDAIESVIDDAIENQCNVVVAHHPIIFKGLKQLTGANYVERTIIKAIKHDIAIYAIHTNLDHVYHQGVNSKIAQRLDLQHCTVLDPDRRSTPEFPIGAGLIGLLEEPLKMEVFLARIKERMKADCLKYTALPDTPVQKIAVCGGAGSFLLSKAKAEEAEVFITSDFKYHEFFDAEDKIVIVDIGHYETEYFTIELLAEILSEKFSTFAIRQTSVRTNPVQYWV